MVWVSSSYRMPMKHHLDPSICVRNAFALRLRSFRIAYGKRLGRPLSQQDFAAMLGINRARYGSYERADREPPLETLAALRRVTGVSLDELIGRL